MFAAVAAAENGHEVHIFEKNEKLGKKLFITGKGRCNLTNACDMDALFSSVVTNRKFLYSSFYGFTNLDTIDFFRKLGLATKVERGGRVFPASDHSSDVIRSLEREMGRLGVKVHLRSEIRDIRTDAGKFHGFLLADGTKVQGDACVIATGGLAYPSTGSTGDGYRWARRIGHSVTELSPALVPLQTEESWAPRLQGLSLRNVTVRIWDRSKKLYEEFGEMLFTHYGVSGPVIISVVGKALKSGPLRLTIDLKPALTYEELDRRLLRDFSDNQNRRFRNALGKLFPAKLIPIMIELSGIDPEKKVNEISREERRRLLSLMKELALTVTNLRGYGEAIITRGGVATKEVHPGTMESKIVSGVYFAGEILDTDALTGGFNLQIAWSTARLAGQSIL